MSSSIRLSVNKSRKSWNIEFANHIKHELGWRIKDALDVAEMQNVAFITGMSAIIAATNEIERLETSECDDYEYEYD